MVQTKAHSGEIKIETKDEEGSEFIIQLPNTYTVQLLKTRIAFFDI